MRPDYMVRLVQNMLGDLGGICKNGGHAVFNGKFSFYGTVDCRRNGSDTGAVSGVGFDAGKAWTISGNSKISLCFVRNLDYS